MKPRKLKRHIRHDVKRWSRRLGLDDWDLVLRFGKVENPPGTPDGWQSYASCAAQWQYRSALLTFDVRGLAKAHWTRREVAGAVVHELVHCMVDGLRRCGDPTVLERVVCDVQRALMDARLE